MPQAGHRRGWRREMGGSTVVCLPWHHRAVATSANPHARLQTPARTCDERRHIVHELHQPLGHQHHAKVLAQLGTLRNHVGHLRAGEGQRRTRETTATARQPVLVSGVPCCQSGGRSGPGELVGSSPPPRRQPQRSGCRPTWRTTSLRPQRCAATSSQMSAICGCVCSAHSSVTCDAARPMSLRGEEVGRGQGASRQGVGSLPTRAALREPLWS